MGSMHGLVPEIIHKAFLIELFRDQLICKQAADLGRECKNAIGIKIIKRLYSQAIAGDEQFFIYGIPDSECEHAVEAFQAIAPPAGIGGKYNFGIRIGLKKIGLLGRAGNNAL